MLDKNSRKHGDFAIELEDLSRLSLKPNGDKRDSLTIKRAMELVCRQMKISGLRDRTIQTYEYAMNEFLSISGLVYVEDITATELYDYLNAINVANSTKLVRLKSIKAVLSRFFDNRWVEQKFWTTIQIRVDKKAKPGAAEHDIELLLSLIDRSNFIGYRDSLAILLMYKTGIRIRTLGELREHHIDFNAKTLNLDGAILKNRDYLQLPLDDQLLDLLRKQFEVNSRIRKRYKKRNTFVFLTQNGDGINRKDSSTNAISKQLTKYAKRYGLTNVNAHSIRKAFAKSLLNRGASIPLISKALGHSGLDVTTAYLHLDNSEVVSSLREYL